MPGIREEVRGTDGRSLRRGPMAMPNQQDAELSEIRERLAALSDPMDLLVCLFAASPVAFEVFRADGHCLLVNQAFRALFGDAPPPKYNVFRDEIAAATGTLALVHRAFAGEAVTTPPIWYDPRELAHVRVRGGRRVAFVGNFFPLRDAHGQIAHVAIVFTDVTEEMRARELAGSDRRRADAAERRSGLLSRVHALMSTALEQGRQAGDLVRLLVPEFADACSVFVFDEQGQPHRVAEAALSPEAERLMAQMRSLPTPRALAARHSATIREVHLQRFADYRAWVVAQLGGEDPEYVALIEALAPTDAMLVPLRARGRVTGVLTLGMLRRTGRRFSDEDEALAREIGERAGLGIDNARLFAAAELARRRAEEANHAKDAFLAMLGHELRNPLAPILTALQLMRMRYGEQMLRERAVIERQVRHMVQLVDDLLDVSRITGGKVELRRAPVEIRRVVDKALELAAPLLENRAHRVSVVVPEAGLQVDGDEHRLAQVVANLLSNAAHYTDAGGAIEVEAGLHGGLVRVCVRDNGAGIDPELLPRIFEMFVQGRRSIDRADGGLGLGLTIVRSFVEMHGGTVTAHSRGPGLGSEFVIHLPLFVGHDVGVSGEAGAEVGASPGVSRVLIVDDNRDAAELLAEVLGAGGLVTRVAFDGPGALRMASEFCPEIALLDIGLPVMDGYELGRRLRGLPGLTDVKLVAVTGYGQPGDRERSHAAGFDEHMTKPVDVPQVQEVLQRLLKPRVHDPA